MNGKGMFVYYVPANSYPSQTKAIKTVFPEMVPYGAYLALKTAQNLVISWTPNMLDVLAEDWCVID